MLHQCAILCNNLLQIIFNCTKLHLRNFHALVAQTGEHMKFKHKMVLIGMLVAGSAQAQFKTGNQLYSQMQGNQMEQMNAIGYVQGVSDAFQGAVACIPTTVTAGQVYDMTKLHVQNNPTDRNLSADFLIMQVLRAAWPCKKGSGI